MLAVEGGGQRRQRGEQLAGAGMVGAGDGYVEGVVAGVPGAVGAEAY
jgi:hypothetical protein